MLGHGEVRAAHSDAAASLCRAYPSAAAFDEVAQLVTREVAALGYDEDVRRLRAELRSSCPDWSQAGG